MVEAVDPYPLSMLSGMDISLEVIDKHCWAVAPRILAKSLVAPVHRTYSIISNQPGA
jgi:hypothetical protein